MTDSESLLLFHSVGTPRDFPAFLIFRPTQALCAQQNEGCSSNNRRAASPARALSVACSMVDQLPSDLEHIQRLLDGEAELPDPQQMPVRKRQRTPRHRMQEATTPSPAAEAILDRAKQPSEQSTQKYWHCELCNVRVTRPASTGTSAGQSADWSTHLRGKVHRRNEASVHLHGEAGHSVLSVFEQWPGEMASHPLFCSCL